MEHPAYVVVTAEGTVRLVLAGSLVLVRHADVLTHLEQALKAEPSTHVAVDLTEVTSMDSSGVALLLLVRRCARRAAKTFHVAGTPPEVLRHLHLAGLTVFLGLRPPDDARLSRTGGPAPPEFATSGGRAAPLAEVLDEAFGGDNMGHIRRQLSGYADGLAMSGQERYNLLLAATEIMTNAVRYGGGSGHITAAGRGNLLFLSISDSGRGIPRRYRGERPRPRPGHIGLYGLWLVGQICQRVDIDTGPGGTRVQLTFAVATG
ncbi:STAS domain-containing protein [Actinoplanes sp. L3-i22]|uniref:STAS domain-containing protein n=1 Tax=Actinoplanes sp. L3-i22 TaxID=2836373 RepID=UPI001C788C9D|nr:STAS domain-containing protein [Actinoplanes sp. L3-i22]BCY05434.1 hypothetical protein L3i22_005220 [Actinoplanes sp. L3-i22]